MRRPLSFFVAAGLIAGALTTIGAITAPAAEACVTETCGASLTMLRLSPGPYVYGEPITMWAIVKDHSSTCALPTDIGCTQPTGSVSFIDGDNLLATRPLLQCVPVQGSELCLQSTNESETLPGAIKRLAGGDHTILAKYRRSGPDGFNDSEQQANITIEPAPTTTAIQPPTPSVSVVGQPITIRAKVTPTNAPDTANGVLPPRGAIAFLIDGAEMVDVDVSASGEAEWTTTLPGGSHTLAARYDDDAFNYANSTSSAPVHTVAPADTTSALTQSDNPTVFGQGFTLTDTVSTVASGPPTGLVTFKNGTSQIGSPTSLSAGVATQSVTALQVGSHTLTASYAGDPSFNGSNSNTLSHTVNKAGTTSVLSIAPASATPVGDPVTLKADITVNHPGAGTPTGTVQFKDGGTNLGGPVALTPTGATLVTSTLGGGAHPITAMYSGDSNFATSTSALSTHTVLCTTTVNGSVAGTYNVPATGTTCITNANISGGVNVPAGATVSIVNSTIGGYLQATNAVAKIVICGSTIPGITVNNAAGSVTIGDPYTTGCAGNVLSSSMALGSNHGGVRANGNRIGSGLAATSNNGGSTVIGGNTIAGWLQCSGNTSVTNEAHPNSAGGRTGQCAVPATF